MEILKSVDALYKYLNERPVGTPTCRHLTRTELGDELQDALQKDCEMDILLVRSCVEAKGWEMDIFPDTGNAPPSFAIILAGETTITAYIKPQEVDNASALVPVANKGKWQQILGKIKHFFLG